MSWQDYQIIIEKLLFSLKIQINTNKMTRFSTEARTDFIYLGGLNQIETFSAHKGLRGELACRAGGASPCSNFTLKRANIRNVNRRRDFALRVGRLV